MEGKGCDHDRKKGGCKHRHSGLRIAPHEPHFQHRLPPGRPAPSQSGKPLARPARRGSALGAIHDHRPSKAPHVSACETDKTEHSPRNRENPSLNGLAEEPSRHVQQRNESRPHVDGFKGRDHPEQDNDPHRDERTL